MSLDNFSKSLIIVFSKWYHRSSTFTFSLVCSWSLLSEIEYDVPLAFSFFPLFLRLANARSVGPRGQALDKTGWYQAW